MWVSLLGVCEAKQLEVILEVSGCGNNVKSTSSDVLPLRPDEPSPDHSFQSQLMVPNQVVNADSSPETSPVRPLPRSASTANLQSASKLILSSKLVYSKRLDLPHGVEVTRATPSAG